MYRQFLLCSEDLKYQRILWRNSNSEVETHQINTVTFGLSAAPYLAIRCLKQLAEDEGHRFPRASSVLQRDFYVDDALTGADTICEEALSIRTELTELFQLAGLKIRKWAYNNQELLNGLSDHDINQNLQPESQPLKTLGIFWRSSDDSILYSVEAMANIPRVTKRSISSVIARIYDPLGLLAPVIVRAKMLLQRVWALRVDWDESLATDLHLEWNRISEIQTKTSFRNWRHVPTNDNPADLISRGHTPEEFLRPTIWQHGPEWLQQSEDHWPTWTLIPQTELLEQKRVTCLSAIPADYSLLQRHSSWPKLIRIIACCLRWKQKHNRATPITAIELNIAHDKLIKLLQGIYFSAEIRTLQRDRNVTIKGKLTRLNPFIDKKGILRVGGRLSHSSMTFTQKHPIILPKSSVTARIIDHEHNVNMHSGIQATLYAVRRRYWPIDGPSQVWHTIKSCVRCCCAHPPLPEARVTESRSFTNVGVDYCGPFHVKETRDRDRRQIKAYVAIFVCLAVKAVHIELVGDLMSEAFIAALRRDIPSNRLSRWQHLQQLKQHFWNRWHKEYLNELSNRTKWSKGGHSIQEGAIVILREDNVPPMQWPLGRVVKAHPGADGVIRTATVQTTKSILDRSVKRLVPLPIQLDFDTAEQPAVETK
ncbi:uncharacterized protein LOC132911380 [Bombus pascuorum]|uniref:uncharacterized protein LOC132911380 n=1 Tax=Bombus pascuorum TaxID=65598 RepID=UPI00298D7459|nr:uncharacterized protein LOC132911380 [Bombus pascuorum]